MKIEQIGMERIAELNRLGAIAFTYAISDDEQKPDPDDASQWELLRGRERWGMIDEATGRIMGGMILVDFQTRIGERWLPLKGIGGVATLPEYRRSGVIRNVFKHVLPRMYADGAALASLYPFSHEFYRKFGFETFGGQNRASVNLDQLRRFPEPAEVRLIVSEQDMLSARIIYEKFAAGRNLAMRRNIDYQWSKNVMQGDPYKTRQYKYLLMREAEGGAEPCAYISFRPEESGAAGRIADAREAAYVDADGLHRLLGFMSTFYPHYKRLRMMLPGDVNLAAICPDCGMVKDNIEHGYMLRAINARLLLESQPLSPALRLAASHEALGFSLALTDEFIPENTGLYNVAIAPDGVRCTKSPLSDADIVLDIPTFTQLATGSLSFRQAAYSMGFRQNSPCPAAEALFTGRPQYIADFF